MGKTSKKLRLQAKRTAQRTAKHLAALNIPIVSEHDLLAFQLAHFRDDSKPDKWFVDCDTALNFEPEGGHDDDGLGFYDDGTKRTLTDDHIKMFRHSEIQYLLRRRRLEIGQEEDQNSRVEHERDMDESNTEDIDREEMQMPASPHSDASSLESDLVGLTQPVPRSTRVRPSRELRSQSSQSTISHSTARQRRNQKHKQSVPYNQRYKRKWERYIEDNDPIEGSRTHRRILREMDDRATERLDINYDDEMPRAHKRKPAKMAPASPGRKVIFYEDD